MKFIVFLLIVLFHIGCSNKPTNTVDPRLDSEMPKIMLWAWERPEDLRFIDVNTTGVAFLAQTITLRGNDVIVKKRRQPLEVPEKTYLIAVTRIESVRSEVDRPSYDKRMIERIAAATISTLGLPHVRGIQIDFDAVVSEREFYRKLMLHLRQAMTEPLASSDRLDADEGVRVPLTMTALASWCAGDTWLGDMPVDEAVPMAFVMGADADKIKNYLANGNDWREPLCRGSYGISIDEPKLEGLKPGRRTYYFKNSAWQRTDLDALK